MQLRSQTTIWSLLASISYRLGEWRRRYIRLTPRTVAGLLLWPLLFASYSAGRSTDLPFGNNVSAGTGGATIQRTVATKPTIQKTAKTQPAAAPTVLPADTGLHPEPGPPSYPMAPRGSYANSYAWGNCTWYVAGRRQVPAHWGNAKNWYYAAQNAGWEVGAAPRIGAIAWTPAGWLGHVALVEAIHGNEVVISEMNFSGLGHVDQRTVNAGAFKYIYQ